VFGDGATSKGDVAEALNIAGVWKVPAVFVVNNNDWAISVPRKKNLRPRHWRRRPWRPGCPASRSTVMM
jgi:2-oxoisovalerate dehydrogenase E1 component alpha subunit